MAGKLSFGISLLFSIVLINSIDGKKSDWMNSVIKDTFGRKYS